MARAPFSTTTSERVKIAAGRAPEFANTRWIGRASVAPAATRITAPSPMKAVLSATATSSLGTTLPRCAVTSGSPAASAAAMRADRSGPARGRRDRTARARTRHRRTRCGAPRARPSSAPARAARALAAASGAAASGMASRISGAQVGVFPLLDAPVRQAVPLEAAERLLAQRRDRAARPAARPWRRRSLPPARSRPRS